MGYLVLGMRDPKEACVGDTFGEVSSTPLPRPSFRQAQPVVSLAMRDSGVTLPLPCVVDLVLGEHLLSHQLSKTSA